MSTRSDLLLSLCDKISCIKGRAIVAIDGVDGAGKTVFSSELASILSRSGRDVIQASVDGFHHKRELRYKRGKSDPQGFFEDSYNYEALRVDLISPFRNGEAKVFVARFDHTQDKEIPLLAEAGPSSVLLIDGIFLHRDELVGLWDFSIYLSVPFSVSYMRMASRDGSNPDPEAVENKRYYEGQKLYLGLCQPQERATVVVDNSVIEAPVMAVVSRSR
jgi:uridine kinase